MVLREDNEHILYKVFFFKFSEVGTKGPCIYLGILFCLDGRNLSMQIH